MEKKKVLVITKKVDPTADYLFQKMENRNILYFRLNVDSFQNEFKLSLLFDKNDISFRISNQELTISNKDIKSVFLRRKPSVKIEDLSIQEARAFGEKEYYLMVYWWIRNLSCKFIDTDSAIENASNKFKQLERAKLIGLNIPETIITNDSIDAKNFYKKNYDNIIGKTLGGHGAIREDGFFSIYTTEINYSKRANFKNLRYGPAILQEKIEKSFELRITVVGKRFFSCKIDSQLSDKTRLDWRRYDITNTPHTQFDLPNEIKNKLLKLMEYFDIHFVAFDMAVTPLGEFIFFEMNPSPQWVWIEKLTGLKITDAIIDELIN